MCGDVAARGLVAALGEDITVRAHEDGAEGSIPVGARLHGEFDAAPEECRLEFRAHALIFLSYALL